MLETKEDHVTDTKKVVDWTVFIIAPAGLVWAVILFLNVFVLHYYNYSSIFLLLLVVWFLFISNSLIKHKKVNGYLHVLVTLLAIGMIILAIISIESSI